VLFNIDSKNYFKKSFMISGGNCNVTLS